MKRIDLAQTGDIANLIHRIGKNWMLITAGTPTRLNTMTASWGGIGVLWHRPMVNIFIRPERYTYEFIEAHEHFSLAFFDPAKHRETLTFCGKHSGRNVDKVSACAFTVAEGEKGGVFFEEADLVLLCQKRYRTPLDLAQMMGFDTDQYYGDHGNPHVMYMGEIVEAYTP